MTHIHPWDPVQVSKPAVPSDLSSWQLTSLAAEAAVPSGRVPMVTFSYLLGTEPRAVLSGANFEGLIN